MKKFNGEDIDMISPTLGFNIKTLEHRGLVKHFPFGVACIFCNSFVVKSDSQFFISMNKVYNDVNEVIMLTKKNKQKNNEKFKEVTSDAGKFLHSKT